MKTDKWSAILNGAGLAFYAVGTIFFLLQAAKLNVPSTTGMTVLYMVISLLYWSLNMGYHALRYKDIHYIFLRKLDHVSVYYFIGGTFTPCITRFGNVPASTIILLVIWIIAIIGTILVFFWKKMPEGSSVIISFFLAIICIISMIIFLQNVPIPGIWTFFIGTNLFITGGIIYAMKKPRFKLETYGSHEFYHTLALIGTIFLYFLVYIAVFY